MAIDVTVVQLPKSPENTAKYNKNGKCNWPRAHAVAMYDVLNKIFIDCTFEPYQSDERLCAENLIDKNFNQNKQIITIDRGFASLLLFDSIIKNNKFFVCRAAKNFSKEVVELLKSSENDKTTLVKFDYKRTRTNRRSTKIKTEPIEITVRIVKIQLNSGEFEILITNLQEKDFSLADLHSIYGMRWGIETSFESLKNQLMMEQFNSILENSLLQEFYANLILYGLSSMLSKPVEEMVKKKFISDLLSTRNAQILIKQW